MSQSTAGETFTEPNQPSATPIVLIHGTWCTPESWGDFVPALEQAGFEVHTPALRYHDLPMAAGADKIADLSLTDYVDDLCQYVQQLPSKPILLGHSLGGLLAQLVAARLPDQHRGLILLGTAPMAGIFALYPHMLGCFYQHYLQWGFWKKPLYPTRKRVEYYCMNHQSQADRDHFYQGLVAESGRVYAEMALWFLDPHRAAKVDTTRIKTPVLIISGTDDRIVNSRIARGTAKRYPQSKLVILQGSDHMYGHGPSLPRTMTEILTWTRENQCLNDHDVAP